MIDTMTQQTPPSLSLAEIYRQALLDIMDELTYQPARLSRRIDNAYRIADRAIQEGGDGTATTATPDLPALLAALRDARPGGATSPVGDAEIADGRRHDYHGEE